MLYKNLIYKNLGLQDYLITLKKMQEFTQARNNQTPDELWITEHPSVFTLGKHADPSHLLIHPSNTSIPIINTDRGGEITYHGPGQLILYFLLDLKRTKMGPKELVCLIESSVINFLDKFFNIKAIRKPKAPGIYVLDKKLDKKIASLGLKITRGCSYHGLSLNINMDLNFFKLINPCGYKNLEMTQVIDLMDTSPLCPSVSPSGLSLPQGERRDQIIPSLLTLSELGILLAQEFALLWESRSSKSAAC